MDVLAHEIRIAVADAVAGRGEIVGDLSLPSEPRGLVLFAHGSGSSRHSPRNRQVAAHLNERAFATLLFDLLTTAEERVDDRTREFRFDIALLAGRLVAASDAVTARRDTEGLAIGMFGASTGAAASLVAAARRPDEVRAVVSRGGRPDLAGDALPNVRAPTLLIVGGRDPQVIELNHEASARMRCEREIAVVPGATHLFEEPGALDEVVRLATVWFERYVPGP